MNANGNPPSRDLRSYHGNFVPYSEGTKTCYFNPLYEISRLQELPLRKFGYLFPAQANSPFGVVPASAFTIELLQKLGDAMIDEAMPEEENAPIPPGYTYWGQFIDHDLTAGTDRFHQLEITQPHFSPIPPDQVVADLENMRTPFFDLDSVYGDADGPFGAMRALYNPEDIVKLKIGQNEPVPPPFGQVPDPELDMGVNPPRRDLPRNQHGEFPDEPIPTVAVIGDLRNDENLAIAQFHLAWLRFHNAVVDALRAKYEYATHAEGKKKLFYEARQQVTWYYQWLVVNDFLRQIIGKDRVDGFLAENGGFFDPNDPEAAPFMPLEFSTAAFRFGHSMVRNVYDYNLNFGRRDEGSQLPGIVQPEAGFNQLFTFTGKGSEGVKQGVFPGPSFQNTLSTNWIIEWDRFFHKFTFHNNGQFPPRFARKIDTRLGVHITDPGMQNEDFRLLTPAEQAVPEAAFNAIMKHLAKRNLLRGYLMSIPHAQAVIGEINSNRGGSIDALGLNELAQGAGAQLKGILHQGGFLNATPLWYYILKEAEVRENGKRLGDLGSWIVGKTFIALLRADKKSYLNHQNGYGYGWHPDMGVVPGVRGIMDVFRFAGVAKGADELVTG